MCKNIPVMKAPHITGCCQVSIYNDVCYYVECIHFFQIFFMGELFMLFILTCPLVVLQALQCPLCLRISSNKLNLKRHMLMHEGKYRYTCSHCSRGFATKVRLYEHLTSHTDQLYFSCNVCQESFRTDYAMKVHKHSVHQIKM